MIEVERLCDVAARRIEPGDPKAGRETIDHQIWPLRCIMFAFNFLSGLIGGISVIVLISSAILIIKGEQKGRKIFFCLQWPSLYQAQYFRSCQAGRFKRESSSAFLDHMISDCRMS